MKGRAARLAFALAIAVVVMSGRPSTARADTVGPEDMGWWSEAQQAPAPAPTIPINTATGTTLLVANDPTGPNAIAAVRYNVPGTIGGEPVDASTASGTLTVKVAASGTVGTPVIVACPITSSWQTAQGGNWSARPKYACATSAKGVFATDGSTVTFALAPGLQARGGVFDLAIVPDPANMTPFSVQLDAPGADSLNVMAAPASADTDQSGDTSTPDLSAAPALDAGGGVVAFPALGSDSGVTAVAPAPTSSPSPSVSNPTTPVLPQLASVSPLAPDKRVQRGLALAVLAAIGAALWWFGGQPARVPRLLGSVGGGAASQARAAGDAEPARVGGLGRFARPRSSRPGRL